MFELLCDTLGLVADRAHSLEMQIIKTFRQVQIRHRQLLYPLLTMRTFGIVIHFEIYCWLACRDTNILPHVFCLIVDFAWTAAIQ